MAEKILIVDDDIQSLRLIGLVLERKGYEIAAAKTGAQALEKAQSENPALIVLDVMMPDISGYEVCRRLRANSDTAGIPIIMFTAKSAVNDKVKGFEVGADDYLTKPIHPQELAAQVETLLLRSKREQEEPPVKSANLGFLGVKGGVGTTTLAVNVAVALTERITEDQRVVLAETRSGLATARLQMGLRRWGTIARLLEQPSEQLDADLVEAQLDEHESGVLLLSGQGEPPGASAEVSPDHAEALVQYLGKKPGYLLLDLGTDLNEKNRRLLQICHQVVVVIDPSHIALTLAKTLLEELNQSLNIPFHKISPVIVKKTRLTTPPAKDTIEEQLHHELAGVIPPAPDLAFHSDEQGIPMIMIQPDCLAAKQIRNLASDLAKVRK